MQQAIERLDKKLEKIYNNPRHLETASNGVFASAIRAGIDVDKFLDEVEQGTAFDFESFASAERGNVLDFLKPEFHSIANSLVNITAGGNGGMASIGRGEFFIAFMSNFEAKISKSGMGDIEFKGRYEEVKHNGGKFAVDKKAGREVAKEFNVLREKTGIDLKLKDYVPNRLKDKRLYTEEQIQSLNGLYWQAIVEEDEGPLRDYELFRKCVRRAFENVFALTDSVLIMNEQLDFVRFFDSETAIKFYSDRIDIISREFEIRNRQNNAVAFYVGKEEVSA
jgi:hypothetical protein